MHSIGAVILAILVSLLAGGAPALAQDPSSSVVFDGVGFTYDGLLGTSVNVTQVPGQPTDIEQPSGPDAPHLAFTLYGPQSEATKVPKAGVAPGVVRFYRTAGLTGYEQVSQQVEALVTLLDERPDLAGYMAVAADGGGDALPYLPVMPAAQVIRAQAHYIDTDELAGVAYITAFRQDVSPFAAEDFWYTFQGLSADGAWYVAVDVVVDASMFPEQVSAQDARRVAEPSRYAEYLDTSVARLNESPPEAFAPPLSPIDALAQSISFDGVSAMR